MLFQDKKLHNSNWPRCAIVNTRKWTKDVRYTPILALEGAVWSKLTKDQRV